MNRDLDYFKEFLEDPSAPTLREFYRMVNEWGNYVIAHKNDFNYLKDKKWQAIRKRLNKEIRKRDREKAAIDAEWDGFDKQMEAIGETDDRKALELLRNQVAFLRKHQDYFSITDEELAEEEKACEFYENQYKRSIIAGNNVRINEQNFNNSIAAIDNYMMKVEEKTGKKPHSFAFKGIKGSKGN